MTSTDWLLDIVLLLVVFRQIREAAIDRRFVLLPLGIVAWAAHNYLHGLPTAGNDLTLVAVFVAIGAVLGVAGGMFTRVRDDGHRLLAKAGWIAATLWVVGMGSRMAFYLWSEHGGAGAIARFSQAHDITSSQAWVTAFVLMALTEVATRIGCIVLRAHRLSAPGHRHACRRCDDRRHAGRLNNSLIAYDRPRRRPSPARGSGVVRERGVDWTLTCGT